MPECYILQGPSGSGKSTLAKILCNMLDVVDVSADDYFIGHDGVYGFDAKDLGKAHDLCYEQFTHIITENKYSVVVDNTNTTPAEYKRYKDYAENNGYTVFVLSVNPNEPVESLHKRNKHNVPFKTIERQIQRMNS